MAVAKSIREAINEMNEVLIDSDLIGRCLDAAQGENGDHAPTWLWIRQMRKIHEKCEALEIVLNTKAIPLLEDFDKMKA